MMLPYNKELIKFAKKNRKNMTPWEIKLWTKFLRSHPLRFQRQKVIDNYIVDFYCAKARIVIELDGGGHYTKEQWDYDEKRTKTLEKYNLKIIRICNIDIDNNFYNICEFIDQELKKSLPQSASLTAPSSEGAFGFPATIHNTKTDLCVNHRPVLFFIDPVRGAPRRQPAAPFAAPAYPGQGSPGPGQRQCRQPVR